MKEDSGKVIGESKNTILTSFTHGIDIDRLMYKEEIFIQKEWVNSLVKAGYLSAREREVLFSELENIYSEMSLDSFNWSYDDEDIHMNIERALTEKLGEVGKKIHLGRSRNDLVATTQRLFVNSLIANITVLVKTMIEAICNKADQNIDIIIAGMTHQQTGQPVRYSHTLLAHANSLSRDITRLKAAQESCVEYMPLGAAAFSGTHLNIDLEELSKKLGFKSCLTNSYDAVGDRDFILDALTSFSILAVHLIRYSSEIIYQSSGPVGIMKLPKKWSTGSSIMPNKRNPDVLEITRAKMHRVISSSNEGLSIVSSVVPSYGSDLHELKRTFFKSYESILKSLEILIPFTNELELDNEKCLDSLEKGHILATDLANKLSDQSKGDFRSSYLKIKEMVRDADQERIQIHQHDSWPKKIDFNYSVECRENNGGTAKDVCIKQISAIRKFIK